MDKYRYKVKLAMDMTDDEFEKCAHLFSVSYGKYSQESDRRPGEQIEMGKKFFISRYKKKGVYIATCHHASNGVLVGQAIYARRFYPGLGTMTWVMQLVVNRHHRKEGIGSKLLHSIWGFSNDFAWGLATANPCTVKALERATFRRCDPRVIADNIGIIKRFEQDIQFVDNIEYLVNDKESQADTHFYIDNSEFVNAIDKNEWKLGTLRPGYEWIAFTFRDQAVDRALMNKHFSSMVAFSEDKLKDAYGRMKMSKHKWASHEKEELDEIFKSINISENAHIFDVGCGEGRHSLELYRRGFEVLGVDFASRNIKKAKSRLKRLIRNQLVHNCPEKVGNCSFKTEDARYYKLDDKSDLALCLYDVVGSFPDKADNTSLLKNIYDNLCDGGYAVISVMNLEYNRSSIKEISNIEDDIFELYNLKASNIMQSSGEVFNADFIRLDKKHNIIYRKEQFENDGELSAEYIIRDKRYSMDEIKLLVEEVGFKVIEARYVRAGHFESGQSSSDCKEILLFLQKFGK